VGTGIQDLDPAIECLPLKENLFAYQDCVTRAQTSGEIAGSPFTACDRMNGKSDPTSESVSSLAMIEPSSPSSYAAALLSTALAASGASPVTPAAQ